MSPPLINFSLLHLRHKIHTTSCNDTSSVHSRPSGWPCPPSASTHPPPQASESNPPTLPAPYQRTPQHEFPSVFATSGLVTLLEITSVRVLKPYLEPGQLSVGVTIHVSHTVPTPGDALVSAEATYRGKEGEMFVFDIVASDEGGEIGAAVHKRAVVDAQRLLAEAKKRVADSPSQAM